MTKCTCETEQHNIAEDGWILEHADQSVVSVYEGCENVEDHIAEELHEVVREHQRVGEVTARALVLFVSLRGHKAVKDQAQKN